MAETQVCRQCGERKPLDAFARSDRRAIGRRANCRVCQRMNWRYKQYARTRGVADLPTSIIRLEALLAVTDDPAEQYRVQYRMRLIRAKRAKKRAARNLAIRTTAEQEQDARVNR